MQLSDTYGASEKLAMENGRLRNIQIKVKKVICSLNCKKKKKLYTVKMRNMQLKT